MTEVFIAADFGTFRTKMIELMRVVQGLGTNDHLLSMRDASPETKLSECNISPVQKVPFRMLFAKLAEAYGFPELDEEACLDLYADLTIGGLMMWCFEQQCEAHRSQLDKVLATNAEGAKTAA